MRLEDWTKKYEPVLSNNRLMSRLSYFNKPGIQLLTTIRTIQNTSHAATLLREITSLHVLTMSDGLYFALVVAKIAASDYPTPWEEWQEKFEKLSNENNFTGLAMKWRQLPYDPLWNFGVDGIIESQFQAKRIVREIGEILDSISEVDDRVRLRTFQHILQECPKDE